MFSQKVPAVLGSYAIRTGSPRGRRSCAERIESRPVAGRLRFRLAFWPPFVAPERMFETAELGRKLSKEEHRTRIDVARVDLLNLQSTLLQRGQPAALILIGGVEGAGKGEVLNRLFEWMDARYLHTRAFGAPSEDEAARPRYWRYWMSLPERGHLGVFLGSWYTDPIVSRVLGTSTDAELDRSLSRAVEFERALAADGMLIVKLWLHVSKRDQARRFRELEKTPETRFRVTKRDWDFAQRYDDFRRTCGRALRKTSTGTAPWTVIDAANARYRDVAVAEHLVERLRSAAASPTPRPPPAAPAIRTDDPITVLDAVDLTETVSREEYQKALPALQAKLAKLCRRLPKRGRSLTVVFEGWDAAGKGSAIRRIIWALDARQYRVIPIAAPTDEERAHHYLWRFWRHLPKRGQVTLYDRSWYGRVLVERVEGFAREQDWRQAYLEINDFEEQLVEDRVSLVKLWLHISAEEQLARFEARKKLAYKQHKLTEEDYRNREKRFSYEQAAHEMFERTSTEYAPWHRIAANDKRAARLSVLRAVIAQLERDL